MKFTDLINNKSPPSRIIVNSPCAHPRSPPSFQAELLFWNKSIDLKINIKPDGTKIGGKPTAQRLNLPAVCLPSFNHLPVCSAGWRIMARFIHYFRGKAFPFLPGACEALKIKEMLNASLTQNLAKRYHEHRLNKKHCE
jgi:hypothetical protein